VPKAPPQQKHGYDGSVTKISCRSSGSSYQYRTRSAERRAALAAAQRLERVFGIEDPLLEVPKAG
jgi:hypothetical protein